MGNEQQVLNGYENYRNEGDYNNDDDDGDNEYDAEFLVNLKDEEKDEEEDVDEDLKSKPVFGFDHRILISATSFWILQLCSIAFGGILVFCVMCFMSVGRLGDGSDGYDYDYGFNSFGHGGDGSIALKATDSDSDDADCSSSGSEDHDHQLPPGQQADPAVSDCLSGDPLID